MKTAQRLANTRPSYIRNILKATQGGQILSLAGGLPDAQLFPMPLLARVSQELFSSPQMFQYGLTNGLPELQEYIAAQHQARHRQQVLVTTGSQQGLDLIARAYLDPGDKVLAESPCYLGALQVFNLAEAELSLLPAYEQGPDLAALEAELAQGEVKIFYAVPDFHNPTGYCWSMETRTRVAALMDRYQILLVEDAPYRQLRYSGDELPMVSDLMQGESLVLGSFSKVATPGMRLGYVFGAEELLEPLQVVKQANDLHTAVPMQQMMSSLLMDPEFASHIDTLKHHYGQRCQILSDALSEKLGSALEFQHPQGGMFIWARLGDVSATALAESCLQHQLAIVPGQAFWPEDRADYQAVRLNFSCASPDQLQQAAGILAKVMDQLV